MPCWQYINHLRLHYSKLCREGDWELVKKCLKPWYSCFQYWLFYMNGLIARNSCNNNFITMLAASDGLSISILYSGVLPVITRIWVCVLLKQLVPVLLGFDHRLQLVDYFLHLFVLTSGVVVPSLTDTSYVVA